MKDFELVIEACHRLLKEYPGAFPARTYLNARASAEAQEKFKLGFHPGSEAFDALLSILDEQVLLRAKLRYDRFNSGGVYQRLKSNTFENHNVVLPYRDVYGNIVAIVGRTLLSEEEMEERQISKYKNTSFEKKSHVFGLYEGKAEIIRRDAVFVVEGQFDVITAHDAGINNVVALGSSSLTLAQLALIKRYTNNIYLLLDNDEAGKIGTDRIITKFGSYANLLPKEIPAGYKDLDDLLRDCRTMKHDDLVHL